MESMRKKILVVDDNEEVRKATRLAFDRDFKIIEAADEEDALSVYQTEAPDVVFLDIDFNGFPRGWDILRKMRSRKSNTLIILVTGTSSAERYPYASLADGFFIKPFEIKPIRDFLAKKGML